MLKLIIITLILITYNLQFVRAESNMIKRNKMVEEQIIQRGIHDEKILYALRKVERHLFVPNESSAFAYADHPLSIGHKQTISQPYIVAYMTDAAKLNAKDKVLEIGTGSGYQAAILAEIISMVYSIEIIQELAESAQQRLDDLGYDNILIKHGDGYQGWNEHAPFDAIIVTAAPKEIPQKLIEQLAIGGRMVIPIGSFNQELYLITKTQEGIKKTLLIPVRFVPMVDNVVK
jgi:protein-L-isoaspartate(D-aspartate) O-methyltransferase